jgi:hypothetical protein
MSEQTTYRVTVSFWDISGRIRLESTKRFGTRREAIRNGRKIDARGKAFPRVVAVRCGKGPAVAWWDGSGSNRWCYA